MKTWVGKSHEFQVGHVYNKGPTAVGTEGKKNSTNVVNNNH